MIGVTVCTACRGVRLAGVRVVARRPAMPKRSQPTPAEPCSRCGSPEATVYPDLKQALCDDCLPIVQARKGRR